MTNRWLVLCNPSLASLITQTIGSDYITQLSFIQAIRNYVHEEQFCSRWRASKLLNKQNLAEFVKRELAVTLSTTALFDVQIKRIHEYKRQLMNIL